MTLNLKSLGLILVAVFATSAFMASVAQADKPAKITAEQFPLTIDGWNPKVGDEEEEEGEAELFEHTFTRLGRAVSCKVVTVHATVSGSSESITLTPTYSECKSILGPATINMNGCTYVHKYTADIINNKHTYTAITDVTCPAGKQIEINLYMNHTGHTSGTPICQYQVGAQAGLQTIDLTNRAGGSKRTPKDWIRGHVKMANITSAKTFGSVLTCGPTHDSSATWDGELELKGTNDKKEPNGITVSTVT